MIASIATRSVKAPATLQWWEWMKLLGAFGLVALLGAKLVVDVPPPAIAAVLHLACDSPAPRRSAPRCGAGVTFQSDETAARKGERGRHLLVHALCAGALPFTVAGLEVSFLAALTWGAVGFLAHYGVDYTRKYGAKSMALGVTLDQASHLLMVLVLI